MAESINPSTVRVMVFGDLMLDRTIHGAVDRTSPEAPVMVLQATRTDSCPGGASAVAHLIRGFERDVQVHLVGVVGDDRAADELRGALTRIGIPLNGLVVDTTRPTTVKERFIGQAAGRHSQQVLRVDFESTEEISADIANFLWEQVVSIVPTCDVVLVSDYAKGVCTAELLSSLFRLCRQLQIPVIVDPARRADCDRYLGADLIKPNRTWLEAITGELINELSSAQSALVRLRQRPGWNQQRVLLTLDRQGIVLDDPDSESSHIPARIRSVYDVTGAGDMVQAVMGVCIATELMWQTAMEYAVAAAGLEVERPGVAAVTWTEIAAEHARRLPPANKILLRSAILSRVDQVRRQGRTVIFTNGCFDLLHAGHVRLLQQAAELGDFLVVAINSDDSVKRLKGPQRPFIAGSQRAELLAAIGCVDLVVVFDDDTPIPLLQELQPDFLVKGAQYAPEQVVGGDVVEGYGGRVVTLPMIPGLSTTWLAGHLVNRLQGRPHDFSCASTNLTNQEGSL